MKGKISETRLEAPRIITAIRIGSIVNAVNGTLYGA